MNASFSTIKLSPGQYENLDRLGYTSMTPIQEQCLPVVIAGKDLIAKAKTGSGKTAAFAIGLLERLNPQNFNIQILTLCPTRELATQVSNEFRSLAKFQANIKVLTLCGGQPIGPQTASLKRGAHIVVGTPGRILDHLKKNRLDFSKLISVVLDEADRMLDMGFYESIQTILEKAPKKRQTLLFSATYPPAISDISGAFQQHPVSISIDVDHSKNQIEQHIYNVAKTAKKAALKRLLLCHQPTSCLIFCNMKKQANELCAELRQYGFSALTLHGDLEQRDRDQVLVQFQNQSCPILIATDLAARGIDIDDLPMVINFDLPKEPEIYTHRIGRTGRAGKKGLVINLATDKDDFKIETILRLQPDETKFLELEALNPERQHPNHPKMKTLRINAGRKEKLRPGDILGALTGEAGLKGENVGKIDIFDTHAFVGITSSQAKKALDRLTEGKIKGRKIRVQYL